MSHAGKVLLKVIARRLSEYYERQGLLPEEQSGFRASRSTIDIMFVVRRLQELGRKAWVPLFLYFIDIQKAYDSVDRNLLWQVLFRLGVPPKMITVIRTYLRSSSCKTVWEDKGVRSCRRRLFSL